MAQDLSLYKVRIGSGQALDVGPEQSLLEALEHAGLPWPSSCRSGTCRTCVGQLMSGQVHYAIPWPGLSREEKAEGWVLPCVARPSGDVVLQDPFA